MLTAWDVGKQILDKSLQTSCHRPTRHEMLDQITPPLVFTCLLFTTYFTTWHAHAAYPSQKCGGALPLHNGNLACLVLLVLIFLYLWLGSYKYGIDPFCSN